MTVKNAVKQVAKLKRGFTLIELLVVILIIGILTAVAVPMYQRAVLKSRFSALMPLAKSVANAQEAYYLANGRYATNVNALDIDVPKDAKVGIEVSQDTDGSYAYVLAYNDDINANYIVYQEHSENFPYNIHCEADKNDSNATWLCDKGLNGEYLTGGKSLSGGNYETYILEGSEDSGNFGPNYRLTFDGTQCVASDEAGKCKGVLIDNQGDCNARAENSCTDSTFDHGSVCRGKDPGSCSNSIFKNGSRCVASAPGACADTTYESGACCEGLCPDNAPKC